MISHAKHNFEDLDDQKNVDMLVAFHTKYKMLLFSHCETSYREMGRVVADGATKPFEDVITEYKSLLKQALSQEPTRKTHANVLMHMLGHFKANLDKIDRQEILGSIADYKKAEVPLSIPIGLISYHADRLAVSYLQNQIYLNVHGVA